MQSKKQNLREDFRTTVFKRDKNTCVTCGDKKGPFDAHHIIGRDFMPSGGYIKENGITLCPQCHIKAEKQAKLFTADPASVINEKYAPLNLYRLIKSSATLAYEKSISL